MAQNNQNQNNVNVNINAVPKGFERARQQYEAMSKQMMDGAKNYSRNQQEQLRFIREESAARKKEYDEWLTEYKDKSSKLEALAKKKAITERQHAGGRIDEDEYKRRTKSFKAEERDLLKDTGYKGRNAAGRYIQQEGQELAIAGQTVPRLEQLTEIARAGFRNIVSQEQASARDMIRAIQHDPNASPEQKLAAQMAEEHLNNQKKDKDKDSNGFSVAKTLAALAWDKSLGLMAQTPNAKNELDLIKPFTSMMGALTGGLIGAAADLADVKVLGTGLGQANFTGLGTALGEKVGDMVGSALTRSYQGREELTKKNMYLQSLTGQDMGIDQFEGKNGLGATGKSRSAANLQPYGLDYKQTADVLAEVARASGSSTNLNGNAENTIALQKAYGLDRGVLTGLMELQRSSQIQNRDVLRLTSGVLKSGNGDIFKGDQTFLGEFLQKNFTGLQKELLKGQSYVATGTTMDLLKRFNGLGGEFSAKDPRSMGLISQIQNSLSNPGSDNVKALAFSALRRANPSMGIADLTMEREKGLASPTYLKSMLGYVDQIGGDDQMKRMNIAGMFGVNQSAAKRIFENRAALSSGRISMAELNGDSEASVRAKGKAGTSYIEKQTADFENEFIEDVAKAVKNVTATMTRLFGKMSDELFLYIDEKMRGKRNNNPIVENTTTAANGVSITKYKNGKVEYNSVASPAMGGMP
jgi:hypothetical protein